MTDLTTTIDTYLDAYSEPDVARRADLIEKVWATDGRLTDPPFDATGHEGVSGLADVALQHFPGHRFRRASAIDAHHEFARYAWELVAPDGRVSVGGVDVVEVDGDGKLRRVTGFFGDLAPYEG